MTPLLIVYEHADCPFTKPWIAAAVAPYLKFEQYDSTKTYAAGTLFYMSCLDVREPMRRSRSEHSTITTFTYYDRIQRRLDQGFRIIMDNLWEIDYGAIADVFTIRSARWFWYNESLWYRYLGYDQYIPDKNTQYRALLPMNKRRSHRTDFLRRIDLGRVMWSYVENGQQLPHDQDMTDWNTQRYFNPLWYDRCYMSMVVETTVMPESRYTPVFITEKTFKPIAFRHPFLVYGNPGTLAALRSWGFETFDNLWDESYDTIPNAGQRRDAVVSILDQVEIQDYCGETLRRLAYNTAHFFDHSRVLAGLQQDIIDPILNYAETR